MGTPRAEANKKAAVKIPRSSIVTNVEESMIQLMSLSEDFCPFISAVPTDLLSCLPQASTDSNFISDYLVVTLADVLIW